MRKGEALEDTSKRLLLRVYDGDDAPSAASFYPSTPFFTRCVAAGLASSCSREVKISGGAGR